MFLNKMKIKFCKKTKLTRTLTVLEFYIAVSVVTRQSTQQLNKAER